MALLMFLLLVAVILGAVGLVVKGLLWLFFIGLVIAIVSFVAGGFRFGRRRTRY